MKTPTRHLFLPFLAATVLGGCADNGPDYIPQVTTATLTRAESCEHLLSLLQEDARAKVDMTIDSQILWLKNRDQDNMFAVAEDAGGGDLSAGGDPNGAAPPEHSDTNVQVEGVDEADIVKTDGNYLYVLQGTQLAIVNAYPAETMSMGSSVAIEGHPLEMFLTDEHVVVFSSVPMEMVTGQQPVYDEYGYYGYQPMTKVTVLAHDGGSAPVTVQEHYFEGNYTSSRRIDSQVRTVLSSYYYAPFLQLWPNEWSEDEDEMIGHYENLRLQNYMAISRATLDDFIPDRYARENGELVEVAPSCGDFYVPTSGSTAWGYTNVASFDLNALESDAKTTTIVGMSDTVYSSHDGLFVAGHGFNETAFTAAIGSNDPVSTSYTHVHKFDIATDPATPTYVASASVPGYVHDQFSLDEREGVLRMTTTDTVVSKDEWDTQNHLFTLGPKMEALGAVTGLAPGEQVFSARFVGDRGYVVTFRQVDPLFVFDLSNPVTPVKMAELKIPGFSNYMHPIEGGDYLLTVGQDGDEFGTIGAPALQLFDVRDPKAPKLAHKLVLEQGWTEAQTNHKAFTFYQGMLALPFTSWEYDGNGYETRLDLFDVNVDAGITLRGSVDHGALFSEMTVDDCYYYGWGINVRRGVFIEDYVYSISNGGIIVSNVGDMSPVSTLPMPADFSDDPYGCYY